MHRAAARLALAANRSKLANSASTSVSTSTSSSTSACFSTSSSSFFFSSAFLFSSGSQSKPRFSSFVAPRAEAASDASTSASLENLAASSPKRPHRFFVEPASLTPSTATAGAIICLPPTEARHARKVLRLRPGATVELCDGKGSVALGKIMEQRDHKRDPLSVELYGAPVKIPPPSPRLSLAVAALGLKGGRGDWLVEKAAELGAASLVPLATERSPDNSSLKENDDDDDEEQERRRRRSSWSTSSFASSSSSTSSSSSRVARWHRLAEAAGKQCLRAHALEVFPAAVSVEELARRIRGEKPLLALVAAEGAPPVADVVLSAVPRRGAAESSNSANNGNLVYLIVGPEGDFTPSELEELIAAGVKPCGLGSNRLRVETASEALLAVASALLV